MELTVQPRLVELVHALAGTVVVGGQLVVSVAAWRDPPPPTGGEDALARFETTWRLTCLAAILVAAAFGMWLLRYTLVSSLVLISTPYGPLLGAKLGGTVLFAVYLLVAPPLVSSRPGRALSRRGRRLWALSGALLVVGIAAVAAALEYP